MDRRKIRTDLAVEEQERLTEEAERIKGVILEEDEEPPDVHITRVRILDEEGARVMGKPVGTYLTLNPAVCPRRMRIITGTCRRSLRRSWKNCCQKGGTACWWRDWAITMLPRIPWVPGWWTTSGSQGILTAPGV